MPKGEYSPSDVCKMFGIPRTTLFHWEQSGRIPRTERRSRGERVYREMHLAAICRSIQASIKKEIALSTRLDQPCPSLDQLERLYRAEFFGGKAVEALAKLRGLAIAGNLKGAIVQVVVEEALSRPRGDKLRTAVWAFLVAYG